MGDNIVDLKTSEALLDALKRASTVKLSTSDMLEQRVSFVYSLMDADSDVTREHIKQVIVEQEGINIG